MMIECRYCGKEFKPLKNSSKYCSRECVHKARLGVNFNKPRERQCAYCGETFMAGIHNKTYCSQKCREDMLKHDRPKEKQSVKGKSVKIKSIAEMQREARMLNMSYGLYVAKMQGGTEA